MNAYLIFKALHLVAIISWMAGLLYLPRIFVYHSENINDLNLSNVFKIMEKKLFNYIMMPAMIVSWLFGLLLIHTLGFVVFNELWMQIKIVSVVLLTIYHFYLGACVIRFSNNQNKNSSKFYRIINEIPTILLIIIVFIVVFRPV